MPEDIFKVTCIRSISAGCGDFLNIMFFLTPYNAIKSRSESVSGLRNKRKLIWKLTHRERSGFFFHGLKPALAFSIPARMIYFPTYEYTRDTLHRFSPDSVFVPAIAGGVARTTIVTALSPFDYVEEKLKSKQQLNLKDLSKILRTTLRHQGVASLYRLWVPTMVRDAPFSMAYWGIFQEVLSTVLSRNPKSHFGPTVAGFVGGFCGAVLTQPFTVVHSHMLLTSTSTNCHDFNPPNKKSSSKSSALHAIKKVLAFHGPRGFFKGVTQRVLRVSPQCCIMATLYDLTKILIHSKCDEDYKLLQGTYGFTKHIFET